MPIAPFEQSFDPLPALFAEFTALLRSLTPEEEETPVPGMDWTAGEVGAHVLTVLHRYISPTERAVTRTRLTQLNAEDIAALGKTTAEAADELDGIIAALASVAPGLPLDTERDFHLRLKVTVAAGWANLIGELLVHGDDIARATSRQWTVDDALVEGIWRNLMPAVAGWMRPEARTANELYLLRFSFGSVTLRIDSGLVHIDDERDADRSPDHVIDIDGAAEFTLQFPYRRRCIDDPIAALLASRFTDI